MTRRQARDLARYVKRAHERLCYRAITAMEWEIYDRPLACAGIPAHSCRCCAGDPRKPGTRNHPYVAAVVVVNGATHRVDDLAERYADPAPAGWASDQPAVAYWPIA